MPFFNKATGELKFADGLCLCAGMSARDLDGRPDVPAGEERLVCLPSHALSGGRLAPACTFTGAGLCRVTLSAHAVAGRPAPDASRQRAFLFAALCLRDPCPDTRRSVRVRCPFGELLLFSDPYTGFASARLVYTQGGQ